MSTMKIPKRLLLLVIALFCLGCNKQDDLLIRTIVMGGGLLSAPGVDSFIVFNPDGTTIVSVFRGSMDYEMIKVWRVSDGSPQCTIRFITESGRPYLNAIIFDPSGRLLVSGASDDSIRIWRVSDGSLLKAFKSPFGQIRNLSYSPDGKILSVCHYTGALVLWNMQNDSIIRTQWPPSKEEGPFMIAKFNSDGSELITGTQYGEILFLSAKNGTVLRKFGATGPDLISLIVSRNENILATIHDLGLIKIWRVSDGSLINTIKEDSSTFRRVALNTQGTLLAIADFYYEEREAKLSDLFSMLLDKRDYSVKLYRTSDLTLLHSFKGHRWDVTSVKFSPGDTLLASCGMDRSIKIWDVRKFKGEGLK